MLQLIFSELWKLTKGLYHSQERLLKIKESELLGIFPCPGLGASVQLCNGLEPGPPSLPSFLPPPQGVFLLFDIMVFGLIASELF